ncbi:Diacylglycerol kinase-like protein [Novymonas esmeraldas]|uniref:Diacylglycerol kinase n=1 Tax=Novymonas esmeraldas TaxID=1808958 RepID=A0AAW0F399_9TRYP
MADYPTDVAQLVNVPERPCAFVNKNSGERGSALFVYEQLKKHFGADNVFDLFPEAGKPPAIEAAKEFVAARDPDLLIVAGGDGTVSLGMDIVDAVRAAKQIDDAAAPIAVLPMGTGNDLSRSLGFGGGYKRPLMNAEELFAARLQRIYSAHPQKVDRFSVHITLLHDNVDGSHTTPAAHHPTQAQHGSSDDAVAATPRQPHDSNEDTSADAAVKQRPSKTPAEAAKAAASPGAVTKIFTNYFSIGFDAKVAQQFGDFRNNNPEMCKGRVMNKMWYGCFGCHAMVSADTIPKRSLSVCLDGAPAKVPSSAKAIVVANMITYAGGNVLWSDPRGRYGAPAVDDGKVEVSALEGVWHMVGVGTGTRAAKKIGQSRSLVLYVPANFTMQYDGEPIPAMGTKDQTVKVVIEFTGQSLGMRVRRGNDNADNGDALPLHNEQTG